METQENIQIQVNNIRDPLGITISSNSLTPFIITDGQIINDILIAGDYKGVVTRIDKWLQGLVIIELQSWESERVRSRVTKVNPRATGCVSSPTFKQQLLVAQCVFNLPKSSELISGAYRKSESTRQTFAINNLWSITNITGQRPIGAGHSRERKNPPN